MPPRLLVLLGAGCPPFLRAGGLSVLGAAARRRGRAWEGSCERRGREGVRPQRGTVRGEGHGRPQETTPQKAAGKRRVRRRRRGRRGGSSQGEPLHAPRPGPAPPHLFPGDLTQAGVCGPSGDAVPLAVRPATQMEGEDGGGVLPATGRESYSPVCLLGRRPNKAGAGDRGREGAAGPPLPALPPQPPPEENRRFSGKTRSPLPWPGSIRGPPPVSPPPRHGPVPAVFLPLQVEQQVLSGQSPPAPSLVQS